MLGFTKRTR